MFINKLKINGSKTQISYALDTDSTEKVTKLTCYQQRDPDFTLKICELAPKIIRLLDLPMHWTYEEDTLKELNFSYTEKRGLEFVAKLSVKLEEFQTPMVFTAPRLACHQIDESNVLIDRLIEHAIDFINGKRAPEEEDSANA